MPVYKLMAEMPNDEFMKWLSYMERRPPGWRDDDRAHRLLQFLGDKRRPEETFHSLKAIYRPSTEPNMLKSLRGSALFARMLSAKSGDHVPVIEEIQCLK